MRREVRSILNDGLPLLQFGNKKQGETARGGGHIKVFATSAEKVEEVTVSRLVLFPDSATPPLGKGFPSLAQEVLSMSDKAYCTAFKPENFPA
jgi:hypothetical protein